MSQVLHAPSQSSSDPDAEASRLYAEYADKIYRFCLGQLRSREEAEDAVQNTFLRVCTALRKGVVPEFEGPWLYKIAHNVCLSRRLGSSRRARVETPSDLDVLGERAAAHTPDADELFGLDDALADMPANLRRPLLMREWQGMSYAEISEALGVSHSAVETLIFRARRHLAQALTDSIKKTGRAVASIFNIRWLYGFFKGVGGGVSGMGVAAGAAGLVVAIGGGVAIDLATQHASAAPKRIAAAAADAPVVSAEAARTPATRPAAKGPRGARFGAASTSASSTTGAGAKAGVGGGRHPASGPSTAAAAQGAPGAASSSSQAAASGPSVHQGRSPSSSSHASAGAGSSGSVTNPPAPSPGHVPSPTLPPAPSVPDPGSVIPPVTVPSVPGVDLPPAPALPPIAPPSIAAPSSLVAEATGPLGAVVSYTVTASNVDGAVPVSCVPASGSTFHLGHTTVSCSSTDGQGNTSRASFDVQVRDTTAPTLSVPGDITVKTSLAGGVKVSYVATATDLVDTAPKLVCTPASGSLFLVQTTTVTCSATDASGNSSTKSFRVTVSLVPALP